MLIKVVNVLEFLLLCASQALCWLTAPLEEGSHFTGRLQDERKLGRGHQRCG